MASPRRGGNQPHKGTATRRRWETPVAHYGVSEGLGAGEGVNVGVGVGVGVDVGDGVTDGSGSGSGLGMIAVPT